MKKILDYLFEKKNITLEIAKSLLIDMSIGDFNTLQIAAIISLYNYNMRPYSHNEIEGFRQALLYICLQLNISTYNTIDIVGTGGDKNTFNISTLATFVIAGAGEKVIKHGNYASLSITGSSNILKMLGCKFTTDVNILKKNLEKTGICFLHAPLFYPSIKKIAFIRKNIGTKNILNVLGPLLNPSENHYQLFGVSKLEIANIYYFLLKKSKKKYSIIHSLDGYDEISLTGTFICYTPEGICNYSPNKIGCLILQSKDIKGGKSSEENKRIFLEIMKGNGTKYQNEVVIVNAAFALGIINKENWRHNYMRAKESLESGKAKQSLKKFLNS